MTKDAPTDRLSREARAAFDRTHLWHPYASTLTPPETFEVESAEGTRLTLSDGRRVFDGVSSWWCAAYGHRHPALMRALTDQAAKLPHVMFGGLTHEPAVRLGQRLLSILPEGFHSIFYSDSGSVAVEVAMKMAIQYQKALGETKKTNFATIRAGYHGDTWNAMSVCDPDEGMHGLFGSSLPVRFFIPTPRTPFGAARFDASDLRPLEALLEAHGDEIAALILEPVLQGAGGMRFYHPDFLKGARALCDRCGTLLIFDEIATGFGRTGRMFAMEWAEVMPDIVTLGKALTGGVMTLAATVTTKRVSDTVSSGQPGAFMHGPTFMANPMACAVAAEAVRLAQTLDAPARARRIERELCSGLEPVRNLPGVADVRVLGAVGVVELTESADQGTLTPKFLAEGVWLRPFGKLVYVMPPLVSTTDEIRTLTAAVVKVLSAHLPAKLSATISDRKDFV